MGRDAFAVAVLTGIGLVTFMRDAYAYLDPGTASMLLQGLIGGIAAAARSMRLRFRKLHKRAKSSRWTVVVLGARLRERLRTIRCCLRRRFSAMIDFEPPGRSRMAMFRNK
jgi:hypothetical protein